MTYNETVGQFKEPDAPATVDTVEVIARDRLTDFLHALPAVETLPDPSALDAISPLEPTRIEKGVTVADLKAHLGRTTLSTPEIGVEVFEDGTNVMLVGTADGLGGGPVGWVAISDKAAVAFHTHPGRHENSEELHLRESDPSMKDLRGANAGSVMLIGSMEGISLVPRQEDFDTSWQRYVVETRGFDEQGYAAYGGDKVYAEYLQDEAGIRFMPWSELDDSLTLLDVADQNHQPAA